MTDKKTCGELYQEAWTEWSGTTTESKTAFAAGFIHGQAEKVASGACKAAMFRPSDEWREVVESICLSACRRYGLELIMNDNDEFWISTDISLVCALGYMKDNSPEWHAYRATLCGIRDIDPEYHKRPGHGKPCDKD